MSRLAKVLLPRTTCPIWRSAVTFLVSVKDHIEDPQRLIMDL